MKEMGVCYMYLTKGERDYIDKLDPSDPLYEQRKKLLLNEYREAEKVKHTEISQGIRELLLKDPDMLEHLNNMLKYRELRVEQCLIPIWIDEALESRDDGYFKVDVMREKAVTLDKKRRQYHNKALSGFYRIIEAQKDKGIANIAYSGRVMNPLDYDDNYGIDSVREKMTDAFLDTLYAIEDSNAAELDDRDKVFTDFKNASTRSVRSWGATIKEDDGDLIQ